MKKILLILSTLFLLSILTLTVAAPAFAASPNITVGIEAYPQIVPAGGNTILVITQKNTGDVALTDVWVYLYADNTHVHSFYNKSAGWQGGDPNNNGILDPHETWVWVIAEKVSLDTQFNVYGECRYNGQVIDDGNYATEKDYVIVKTYGGGWWWFLLNWLRGWCWFR